MPFQKNVQTSQVRHQKCPRGRHGIITSVGFPIVHQKCPRGRHTALRRLSYQQ